MKLDYGLYMAECEGFLDTRDSRINAIIKDISNAKNSGAKEFTFTKDYLAKYGFKDVEEFSIKEWRRIKNAAYE